MIMMVLESSILRKQLCREQALITASSSIVAAYQWSLPERLHQVLTSESSDGKTYVFQKYITHYLILSCVVQRIRAEFPNGRKKT